MFDEAWNENAGAIIAVPSKPKKRSSTRMISRIRTKRRLRLRARKIWVMVEIVAACCLVSRMDGTAFAAISTSEESCDPNLGVCTNPDADQSSSNSKNSNSNSNSCRLYIAPTTVGGIEGNYGIFTSVDMPKGATVLANDGPNIPVLQDYRRLPTSLYPDTNHMGLFKNVWWGPRSPVSDQFRAEFNFEDRSVAVFCDLQINFGALPNCHPYRPNLDISQPVDGIAYDDLRYLSGENHQHNPIRGSFSYYTGKHFSVNKPVEAGTELFLDYEADWEQHGFPRYQDHFSAGALVRKWILSVTETVRQRNKEKGIFDFDHTTVDDPNSIYPIEDVIEGAQALGRLIAMSAPDAPLEGYDYKLYKTSDKEETEKGMYYLEQYTSRILSLVPRSTDEWNKIYHKSWGIYLHRQQQIDKDDDEERETESEAPTLDIPSVKDVTDAIYEVTKPPPKSIEELDETGICLDHIVAGHSKAPLELGDTDKTATGNNSKNNTMTIGRGAIAARFLAKGELVVPVPFLHLLERSLFEKLPKGGFWSDELILNYCFGHSQSTMVMCPVTNAVLINHCSDRENRFPCGSSGSSKGPNAEYRWASDSDWDRKTKTTLTMELDDMASSDYLQQHRMLSMEIVATRDISEGEEIFIDYGEKWEEAWLEHVQNWSKDDNKVHRMWSSPQTTFELNHWKLLAAGEKSNHNDGEDPLFYGLLRDPEPAMSEDGRFYAACWYEDYFDRNYYGLGSRHSWDPDAGETKIDENEFEDESRNPNIYWKNLSDREILEAYAIDVATNGKSFTHLKDRKPGTDGHFWPCSVLAKNNREEGDDEDRYLVRIYPSEFHRYRYGEENMEHVADQVLLTNYPRSSIQFMTAPYSGDQYHPKAFRHHIEIRDEIFPEQWKNKKQ